MSFLSGKKLLLLGFIVVLLVAIPVTVYLVQQQQRIRSGATAATTLSFSPIAPQTATVGSTVSFDIYLDPSDINQITFVQLSIDYDSTKLATADAGIVPALWPSADGGTFNPTVSIGPNYTPGNYTVGWSIGANPQNVIKTRTKLGTVTFKAIEVTDPGVATQITFGNGTRADSFDSTSSGLDNVISNLSSIASVNITGSASPTAVPTAVPTTVLTAAPTAVPTAVPTATSGSPTPIPICSNFTIDEATTGIAPYSVNFTMTANSPDSTSIDNIALDFGDGETQEATDSGGIGTNSVSITIPHTYETSGTFNATATITEINADEQTITEDCNPIEITVNDQTSPTTVAETNPSPLPPTGSTGLITVGAVGIVLTFIGILLLLAL